MIHGYGVLEELNNSLLRDPRVWEQSLATKAGIVLWLRRRELRRRYKDSGWRYCCADIIDEGEQGARCKGGRFCMLCAYSRMLQATSSDDPVHTTPDSCTSVAASMLLIHSHSSRKNAPSTFSPKARAVITALFEQEALYCGQLPILSSLEQGRFDACILLSYHTR